MQVKQSKPYFDPSRRQSVMFKLAKRKMRNQKQTKTEKSAQNIGFRMSKVMIGFPLTKNRRSSCEQIVQPYSNLRQSSQGQIKKRPSHSQILEKQLKSNNQSKKDTNFRKIHLSPLSNRYRVESSCTTTKNSLQKQRKEKQIIPQFEQYFQEIQQRFYDQVRILQQFKQLSRMVN